MSVEDAEIPEVVFEDVDLLERPNPPLYWCSTWHIPNLQHLFAPHLFLGRGYKMENDDSKGGLSI